MSTLPDLSSVKKNLTLSIVHQGLRGLPTVLSRNEIHRLLAPDSQEASFKLMLNRWTKSGLLRKSGERTSIYYNLVADPAWENYILEAVKKKYPSAVVIGPSVLHAFGCQTQIPGEKWVAIRQERSIVSFDGAVLIQKPLQWFRDFPIVTNLFGCPSLTPQQALDDHQKYPYSEWLPDEDDIDTDEVADETQRLIEENQQNKTLPLSFKV